MFNHLSYDLELGWKQSKQTGSPDISSKSRDKDCRILSAAPDVRIYTTTHFSAFDGPSFTKSKRMENQLRESPEGDYT